MTLVTRLSEKVLKKQLEQKRRSLRANKNKLSKVLVAFLGLLTREASVLV